MESQESVSDVAEVAQGLVLAMVERFKRNITDFLQGEFALDSPLWQEAYIGNMYDDDIHVLNAVEF